MAGRQKYVAGIDPGSTQLGLAFIRARTGLASYLGLVQLRRSGEKLSKEQFAGRIFTRLFRRYKAIFDQCSIICIEQQTVVRAGQRCTSEEQHAVVYMCLAHFYPKVIIVNQGKYRAAYRAIFPLPPRDVTQRDRRRQHYKECARRHGKRFATRSALVRFCEQLREMKRREGVRNPRGDLLSQQLSTDAFDAVWVGKYGAEHLIEN